MVGKAALVLPAKGGQGPILDPPATLHSPALAIARERAQWDHAAGEAAAEVTLALYP